MASEERRKNDKRVKRQRSQNSSNHSHLILTSLSMVNWDAKPFASVDSEQENDQIIVSYNEEKISKAQIEDYLNVSSKYTTQSSQVSFTSSSQFSIDKQYYITSQLALYTHFMLATRGNKIRNLGLVNVPQAPLLIRLLSLKIKDADEMNWMLQRYSVIRIIASWIEMIDMHVKIQDDGFYNSPSIICPLSTEDVELFDKMYINMGAFFETIQKACGDRAEDYLSLFTKSNVGIDIVRTYLHANAAAYVHKRFFVEAVMYFKVMSTDLKERHNAFVKFIKTNHMKLSFECTDIVIIDNSSDNTLFRIMFYDFICDPDIDLDVALSLIMSVGCIETQDAVWDDRIMVCDTRKTPYTAELTAEATREYLKYLEKYVVKYGAIITPVKETKRISELGFKSLLLLKRATKRGLLEYPSEYISKIQKKEGNVMQVEPLSPDKPLFFLALYRFLLFLDFQVGSNYYKMMIDSKLCFEENAVFPIYQLDTTKQSFCFFGESVFLKI